MAWPRLLPALLLNALLLPALPLLAGCAARPVPAEPSVEGYIHIYEATRDARQACAGLRGDCAAPDLRSALARAEAAAPQRFFVPFPRAAEERRLAHSALAAAEMDCRSREIRPGSPRWDSCKLDRGIARLHEFAALR